MLMKILSESYNCRKKLLQYVYLVLHKTNQNLNWYRKHNYLQNSANIPKLFWKIAPKKKHSSKHTITHPPVISTAISDHLAEIGVQQVILDAAGAQEIIRRGNHLLPDVSRLRDMRRHGCVHRLHTHDEKAGAIHATFGALQCIPNKLIKPNLADVSHPFSFNPKSSNQEGILSNRNKLRINEFISVRLISPESRRRVTTCFRR